MIFGIIFTTIILIIDAMYMNILPKFSLITLFLYLPIMLFSFLIPDIDHRISQPRFIVTVLLLIIIIYSSFIRNTLNTIIAAVILLIIWILPHFKGWGHRGHTHSLIFVLAMSLLVFLWSNQFAVGCIFFIGALSHLVIDMEFKIW